MSPLDLFAWAASVSGSVICVAVAAFAVVVLIGCVRSADRGTL